MSHSKRGILIYQDDFKRMSDWILQYPNSETGGQFFGLWTHTNNPYINIVIGPGKNCRHATHSFHQDIEYLKEVGTFLNTEFMMCHIGEWHSHHRLRIREPSSGDLNSVWKHFPSGVEYFLLVIATIEGNEDQVKLWPYLFTASKHTHELIDLTIIEKDNVFMKDEAVRNYIASGVELRVVDPVPKKATSTTCPTSTDKWFLTEWGSYFVQSLNSSLEKLVSGKTLTIEKHFDKKQSTLQFSFAHRDYNFSIIFPPNFPKAHPIVRVTKHGQKWNDYKIMRQNGSSLVDVEQAILQLLRDCIRK